MIKLPEPAAVESTHGCNAKGPYRHHTFYYTADQLKQAIRDALEEAAKVCDEMLEHYSALKDTALLNGDVALSNASSGEPRACDFLATAIRKLKEDIQ